MSSHSSHDYRRLVGRWKKVARAAGLKMEAFAEETGHPVYRLASKAYQSYPSDRTHGTDRMDKSHGGDGGIYLSAGIHGDEAAGTEALITWAEKHLGELAALPCLIFPCLNPWGLVNNSRLDAQGRDLNRVFHQDTAGSIHALKQIIRHHRFALAISLHEDYDAAGVYIYEIERHKPFWGEALLEVARPFLPIEGRTSIDGRRASGGLVRRKFAPARFRKIGYPEAIYLHQHHSLRTFTIETPSEFAIHDRVAAQVAVLEESLRLLHM